MRNPSLVRVFDIPDESAVNMSASYYQTAIDAAMALFTNATIADGTVQKTGSSVSQYLAENSPAAAQYANGWNPDAQFIASNAQVTGLDGNVFNLDVVFENLLDANGNSKVHIAHVSLAFDETGKITDIACDVL